MDSSPCGGALKRAALGCLCCRVLQGRLGKVFQRSLWARPNHAEPNAASHQRDKRERDQGPVRLVWYIGPLFHGLLHYLLYAPHDVLRGLVCFAHFSPSLACRRKNKGRRPVVCQEPSQICKKECCVGIRTCRVWSYYRAGPGPATRDSLLAGFVLFLNVRQAEQLIYFFSHL